LNDHALVTLHRLAPDLRIRLLPNPRAPYPGASPQVMRLLVQQQQLARSGQPTAPPEGQPIRYRPDMLPGGQVFRNGQTSRFSPGKTGANPSERDLQYLTVLRTRMKLVLGSRRLGSIIKLARRVGVNTATVGNVLKGVHAPSFGLGLALAKELGLDPYVFYAWLWERQQERAWWFPEERPNRLPRGKAHPRPIYSMSPPPPLPSRGSSRRLAAFGPLPPPAEPAPPVAREGRSKLPNGAPRHAPGAFDWRNYDPLADPVYVRVMQEVARRGTPRPKPFDPALRARLNEASRHARPRQSP